jgi:hypothetical protein
MGIDAKVLVRVRMDQPTEDQLTRWSWDICRAVGARNFWMKDGLPRDEYRRANAEWHAAFNAHPEYEEWQCLMRRSPRDFEREREIGDRIRSAVGAHPDELRRAIDLTEDYDDDDSAPLRHGKIFFQDGEPIEAADGEWFLNVSVWTRYYGEGYERGDLLTLCAIAEWCELNIPNCEVWYGGDSSGILAKPFGVVRRLELKKHLFSKQGRDYFTHDGISKTSYPTPAPCGLCVKGEQRMTRHGWGGQGPTEFVAVHCAGCGKSFESLDAGKTWEIKKVQD